MKTHTLKSLRRAHKDGLIDELEYLFQAKLVKEDPSGLYAKHKRDNSTSKCLQMGIDRLKVGMERLETGIKGERLWQKSN